MENYLLVGLGNVGPEFAKTRHNAGVRAVKAWAGETVWRVDAKVGAEIATVQNKGWRVWCLFPHTMMNSSGQAVARWLQNHPVKMSHILIVHDDLETPFGEVHGKDGSAKGHKGVRSVHEYLGTQDVARLFIGIGRPPDSQAAEQFVLQNFSAAEEGKFAADILPRAAAAVTDWLNHFPE